MPTIVSDDRRLLYNDYDFPCAFSVMSDAAQQDIR